MAHCAPAAGAVPGTGADSLVLVGNPNVGKSVVFGALTGTYADVSNFPGTTVEIAKGSMDGVDVIDTPGIYGVSSFNEEETVARDVVLSACRIVDVVDAVHLERDLFLTLQLTDMGIPMVVALNMADEARREGVGVDRDLLEDLLGVPVIETVAVDGSGIEELKAAIPHARPGHVDPELAAALEEMTERVGSRADALLVLEGDEAVAARHGIEPGTLRDEVYTRRRVRVNDLVGHVVREDVRGATLRAKLSSWMMNPLTGIPLLGLLLFLMYKVLGQFVAGTVVGFTEGAVMKAYWVPFVQHAVSSFAPQGSTLGTVLAGEFGVLTMTPTYLLGVILPLVTGFYLLLALLEDSGYLPRIAALSDRALTAVGLNGRAVIPLILGLGCVTMGTLTTRILGNKRERFIATALMAIAVPCSAQIAVIAALMARVAWYYSIAYFGILLAIFIAVGTLLERVTPGTSTGLLIDLPPLRWPRPGNVLRKSMSKVWNFMKEVAAFFLVGAFLISGLQAFGVLDWVQGFARPLTVGWLGLPPQAATAFVMGFVRRDFGAAGFFSMHLTDAQLLVAMVTITLFVPCIASVMVILKERGWRYVVGLAVSSVGLAFLLGGIVYRVIGLLGGA
jgi:ferrous iron transport protein B